MTFHWQTDEDGDEPLSAPPAGPDNSRRRRILLLVASLALVSFVAFFGWRQVQERAAQTEEAIKADVLAVHELARRAAESGDDELYLSLIAPPFDAWRGAQRQLLQEGLLYDDSARLYDLAPLPAETPLTEVVVDPDLTHATVFMQHKFVFTTTAPLGDAVQLRQMQTYSLGPNGWQLAPPPPGFWLPQIRLLGDRITLEYPERDDAVARRLLPYLEHLLSETCALPGLDCPSDLHITVRLVSDPAALSGALDLERLLQGATEIDLPSPSLAGQPVDEQSEAVVIRAYAERVIAPLISRLTDYTCCDRSLLVRAILERQLHRLDLRPWPLSANDYEALMEEGMTLGDALVLQRRNITSRDSETWRQMLSLVEFLEAMLPAGTLLADMDESLDAWLAEAGDSRRFVARWSEFVYARSRSAQLADAFNLSPQGTIQLTCFETNAVAVLRHDLQSSVWEHSLTYVPPEGWQVDAVFPLEGGAGDMIKESRRDQRGQRLARYVWRHAGRSDVVLETDPAVASATAAGRAHLLALPTSSSSALAAFLDPQQAALRASLEVEWWRVSFAICDGGTCQTEERLARPHWSPDGAQMLLEVRPDAEAWTDTDLTLVRIGNLGQDASSLGPGYAPIWLGAEHYAYLRSAPDGTGEELLVAATHDDEPQLLAASRDFAAHLDEELQDGLRLRLQQLQPAFSNPYLLLVQANLDMDSDNYLFGISLDPDIQRPVQQESGGELNIELLIHRSTIFPYRLSPNGRWLLTTNGDEGPLLDLRQGSARPLGALGQPAWSPDGDWLALSRNNDILLSHVDLGYKRPIVQDLANCTFSSVQWR